MQQFIIFTGRNLKIYLRDKATVFFSLLSMLIVILLMVFFLGDMNVEGVKGILENFPGRDAAADAKNAQLLILSWTCAGILCINAVTVTLSAYAVMIDDKMSGKLNSIYTAPVSRSIISCSYIFAAWLASLFVCFATLVITEIFGCLKGLEPFSLLTHLKLLGMIMVNSFTFATLMYVISTLAKTSGAWGGIGTVIGTLVGFLGGIYIPIGSLSDTIVIFIKCTPIIYGTTMFRKIMVEDILNKTFQDLPPEVTTGYNSAMGIDLTIFDHTLSVTEELSILIAFGMIFLVVGILILKYGKKTDR